MDNNLLIKLYERHSNWIVIVKRLGATNMIAEDLVQEMYLKMYKVNKNTIIKSIYIYAYFVLRNLYFDYYKKLKLKRSREVSIEDLSNINKDSGVFEIEDKNLFCMTSEVEASKMIADLKIAKSSLIWYDRKVLELHYSGITMRSISRDTGISLSSIFNTIKNARNTIREYIENEK